jgi:hypothetical protein
MLPIFDRAVSPVVCRRTFITANLWCVKDYAALEISAFQSAKILIDLTAATAKISVFWDATPFG